MIARNNFKVALYKMIILKNILETKLHKEKVRKLDAFEKLIINTEAEDVVKEDAEKEVNSAANVLNS